MEIRELIKRIVEDFEASKKASPITGLSPKDVAELTHVREMFLIGGVQRVQEIHNPQMWLQIGVAFRDDNQARRFLTSSLQRRVRAWLRSGLIQNFFFMHKPPGIRLRFCGRNLKQTLLTQLFEFLNIEKRRGNLLRHEFGLYDAETYQFGGETGIDLAHKHFTYDSLAILDLLRALSRGKESFDLSIVSLLMINDLILKNVLDPAEHWDVWCNMRLAGRAQDLAPKTATLFRKTLEKNRSMLMDTVAQPNKVLKLFPVSVRKIVKSYFKENTKLAAEIAKAVKGGKLLYGIRQILPFNIIFHWNRMGIVQQVFLTFCMKELLNPMKVQ